MKIFAIHQISGLDLTSHQRSMVTYNNQYILKRLFAYNLGENINGIEKIAQTRQKNIYA